MDSRDGEVRNMKKWHSIRIRTLLASSLALFASTHVWAQSPDIPPQHLMPYSLDTGLHSGTGTEIREVTTELIEVPGAPWLRLHFGDYYLGKDSYILLTSRKDGAQQRLDQEKLPRWNNSSAYFNGDAVSMTLFVAPGDENVFVTIRALTVGERPEGSTIESICGTSDDRVAIDDFRVGRINGCTAWLVSNGAVLTAGHCVDYDPDLDGPLLPDGVSDLSGLFEVNVPPSLPDGSIQHPTDIDRDQFPIDTSKVTWRFDGEGQGLGKDWGVFGLNANNDGDRAHILHGFFRMTREAPVLGEIRITGYGVDDDPAGTTGGRNAQNRTEQTDTGLYGGETSDSDPDISHRYRVDTEGANSGSPIIWEDNGWTIGIHTNGGCGVLVGSNSGTSFEVDALEAAIRDWPTTFAGQDTEYVDRASIPDSPTRDGSVFRPRDTVTSAVANVADNGLVVVVEGTYTKAAGNTFTAGADGKAMTIIAPVGVVRIGE